MSFSAERSGEAVRSSIRAVHGSGHCDEAVLADRFHPVRAPATIHLHFKGKNNKNKIKIHPLKQSFVFR